MVNFGDFLGFFSFFDYLKKEFVTEYSFSPKKNPQNGENLPQKKSLHRMFPITRNSLNEFWDFYHGAIVGVGSPKASNRCRVMVLPFPIVLSVSLKAHSKGLSPRALLNITGKGFDHSILHNSSL